MNFITPPSPVRGVDIYPCPEAMEVVWREDK